jgi:hypothetical protein
MEAIRSWVAEPPGLLVNAIEYSSIPWTALVMAWYE